MRGIGPAVGIPLFLSFLSCAGSPAPLEQLPFAAGGRKPWEAPREIEVLSWNLGFGGLGEGAEFYPDGGRRLIPSSRRDVLRYVAGIGAFLDQAEADLFLLQEAARPSAVNRRVDLLAELSARACRGAGWPGPEVSIPFPRVSVGPATFAPGPPRAVERVALPGAKRWHAYHLLVARFPVAGAAGELVLANVHLSAFDEGALLRRRQLEAVTAFRQAEALRGQLRGARRGPNLLLAETRFPHTTAERFLFWIHPLPESFPPPGWRLAADDAVPTVRTLERAYARGENYTAVIDGFVVSPHVCVLEGCGPLTWTSASPTTNRCRCACVWIEALGQEGLQETRRCGSPPLSPAIRGTLGYDAAAPLSALGPQVDDPIGFGDHIEVVFDDYHGVPGIHETVEDADELLNVRHVQADRRLVQHVEAAAPGASLGQLGHELDPLGLPAA